MWNIEINLRWSAFLGKYMKNEESAVIGHLCDEQKSREFALRREEAVILQLCVCMCHRDLLNAATSNLKGYLTLKG